MSKDTPKMMVVYIPANAAWAVVMGDSFVDLDGRRLFANRNDLINELSERGLEVLADGVVVTKG